MGSNGRKGLRAAARASTLVLVIAVTALSVACTNGRSRKGGKSTNAQVSTEDTTPSAYLVSSKTAPYSPTSYVEANVGDVVEFRWNGANVDLVSSYYTVDAPDACTGSNSSTGPHAWVANTLTGSTTLSVVPCQLGRTYTYVYEGIDTVSGRSSRALTVVRILNPSANPPLGLLKAAIVNASSVDITPRLGYIEVTPGDQIRIAWDATGATATAAEITADGTDSCGASGLTLQEVSASVASEVFRSIEPCQAGRIYTVSFRVTRPAAAASSIESKLLIRVRPNPSMPNPVASLTANGATGTVEVTAGQALTFAWGSTNADQGNSSMTMVSELNAVSCEEDQNRGSIATSWNALGPRGDIPPFTIPDCKARHTYTITYTAIQTPTGKASSATVTVKVNPRPGT